MNDFFTGCATSEEVKKRYRELCKAWHPDLGPRDQVAERTAKMQEINAAYARASAIYRQEEMREKAKKYGKTPPTEQDYTDAAAVDERIRQAIEQIITLEGIEIEICGLWVWVSGNTKPHREALKQAKYRWAPTKEKWYFAGVPASSFGKWTMENIRERYGSQRVTAARAKSEPIRHPLATVDD